MCERADFSLTDGNARATVGAGCDLPYIIGCDTQLLP